MNEILTNQKQIEDWLDSYMVKNYTLVPDKHYGYVVDVQGDVIINYASLLTLSVKFNHIRGGFYCSENFLHSLEGSPQTVEGIFHCCDNNLTSLKFAPRIVGDGFSCKLNKITSLEFSPETVGSYFNCESNQLNNLEFCPKEVGGEFNSQKNPDLGRLQGIHSFSNIYQEHLCYNENKKLAQKLNQELSFAPTNSKKIKI